MALVRDKQKSSEEEFVIARIASLVVSVALVCYLLYTDGDFPYTISSVWSAVSHLSIFSHFRLATVGLLPVYVALMVFGAAFVGKSLVSVALYFFGWLKR